MLYIYRKQVFLFFLALLLSSCQSNSSSHTKTNNKSFNSSHIITEQYELILPDNKIEAVLILFGGFPESIADIKREFDIQALAKTYNIAVLYSNINQRLWLEEEEKRSIASDLKRAILTHALPTDKLAIGGFSSGGNVSMLLSNFLIDNNEFNIQPNAVFLIDSPIDLVALYKSSEKNIERNYSQVSVDESQWIIDSLFQSFDHPSNALQQYEKYAVFTSISNSIQNLEKLQKTKIRLYTEPDSTWWQKNRKAEFTETNAYYIEQLAIQLKQKGFKKVDYIPSKERGYRANGDRHPHSWSIVNKKDLIEWIINE
jgi:hypothetical protein